MPELKELMKSLNPFTIIKIIKIKNPNWQNKKVVWITDLEIVTPGDQVGVQLGNPVQISSDRKIPVEDMLTALR